jgi:hypothetical protein
VILDVLCLEANHDRHLFSPLGENAGKGRATSSLTPTLALPHRGGGDVWSDATAETGCGITEQTCGDKIGPLGEGEGGDMAGWRHRRE